MKQRVLITEKALKTLKDKNYKQEPMIILKLLQIASDREWGIELLGILAGYRIATTGYSKIIYRKISRTQILVLKII